MLKMNQFKGQSLVSAGFTTFDIPYKVLYSVEDYQEAYPCIVVKSLHPDYFLLFGSIVLIIAEKGGALSHLAIMAREYSLPIILIEDIVSKIPLRGKLSIKGTIVEIKADGRNK